MAAVPAYCVSGPRQSTSSSGLRQKSSLTASDLRSPSATATACTLSLPASRAVSSTSAVFDTPGAQVADFECADRFLAAAGRQQVDADVFRDAGAGIRKRQAIDVRLAVEHFVRTGDFELELRLLHFDDGPRVDGIVRPGDGQFERPAGPRHQVDAERFGGLGVEPRNLPLERGGGIVGRDLANDAVGGRGVDDFGPRRNSHGRHDGLGARAALVLQPHAVRGLAADGDLLRAADVGRDRRGDIRHEHAGTGAVVLIFLDERFAAGLGGVAGHGIARRDGQRVGRGIALRRRWSGRGGRQRDRIELEGLGGRAVVVRSCPIERAGRMRSSSPVRGPAACRRWGTTGCA